MRESASASPSGTAAPAPDVLTRGVAAFAQSYDARHGGFGGAPKFPRPSELLFLLREHARTQRAGASRPGAARPSRDGAGRHARPRRRRLSSLLGRRGVARPALREDAVRPGAARAGVPRSRAGHWRSLLRAGRRGHAAVRGPGADASRWRFLLRGRCRQPAARGAGRWPQGRGRVLRLERQRTPRRARRATPTSSPLRFGVEEGGNAPFDPHGEFTGKNLLYTAASVDDIVATTGRTAGEVDRRAGPRAAHAVWRAPAPEASAPGRQGPVGMERPDDRGLRARRARAARAAVRPPRNCQLPSGNRATRGAIRSRTAVGLASARCCCGASGTAMRPSTATRKTTPPWRSVCSSCSRPTVTRRGCSGLTSCRPSSTQRFYDPIDGGWFSTTGEDPTVLVRSKEDYDGAEPSPTALALLNLQVLTHLKPDADRTARISQSIARFGTRLGEFARAVPMVLTALVGEETGIGQLVIVEADGRGRRRCALCARRRRSTIGRFWSRSRSRQ